MTAERVLAHTDAGAGRAEGDRPVVIWTMRNGESACAYATHDVVGQGEADVAAQLLAAGVDPATRTVLHRLGWRTAEATLGQVAAGDAASFEALPEVRR